jgi:histidine triad (HIT) family protein
MGTIFSRIIKGEIPCYKIAEDENFFAFLDINPVAKGHILVVPKQETDYIFDLDDPHYTAFFLFSRKLADALKKAIPCLKVGLVVIGLEVPHAHIHLIPMNSMDDVNFSKPKLKLDPSEFSEIAARIRAEL